MTDPKVVTDMDRVIVETLTELGDAIHRAMNLTRRSPKEGSDD